MLLLLLLPVEGVESTVGEACASVVVDTSVNDNCVTVDDEMITLMAVLAILVIVAMGIICISSCRVPVCIIGFKSCLSVCNYRPSIISDHQF